MPFPLKIQPVDVDDGPSVFKPVVKSRFKRLFEWPFGNVLKITEAEKVVTDEVDEESDPSSFCLADMVQNYMEESEDSKCSRTNCNYCNSTDSSDDEFESHHTTACERLKNLVLCSSDSERKVLADIAKIVDENNLTNCTDDYTRKSVTVGLTALGYDAAICKSRWERTLKYPAGEYEYVDVVKEEERLIVDIDFQSQFKIARSTKNYLETLQILPEIFVGKAHRLEQISNLVSEGAKQSLKKRRMLIPPWRRADYVRSKWLSSPYTRTIPPPLTLMDSIDLTTDDSETLLIQTNNKVATTTNSPVIGRVKSPASSAHSKTI